MFLGPSTVIVIILFYTGCLLLIALWAERRAAGGRSPTKNPVIYSLSLALYCTALTYYGSVGIAVTSGMLFLSLYLGPTLGIILWWTVLRKLVRIKNSHHITSIADFISARYDKSEGLAAMVTLIAIASIVPYIALQLKAIFSAFDLLSLTSTRWSYIGPAWRAYTAHQIVIALLIVFTIMFGVRRLDPTERHEGMVMAVAVESVIKLAGLVIVGILVTYFMYDGLSDIFSRLSSDGSLRRMAAISTAEAPSDFAWSSYLILSMFAVLLLPQQFHVAVVENSDEKHIRTAMWLFPLYMLLLSFFIFPVAAGCRLMGFPTRGADMLVARLMAYHANPWLAIAVFIGGMAAATSMIMISLMTLSTMITNHFLLPLLRWNRWLSFLQRRLLLCKWFILTIIMLFCYWFEQQIETAYFVLTYTFELQLGQPYMFINIGMLSFVAVLQFAPAILGGIFWRRANKAGAFLGLCAGFSLWLYTTLFPFFVRSGWLPAGLLEKGPWEIEFLKPEQLFGLAGLDAVSHGLFWTMFFNIGLYFLGSLFFKQSEEEQNIAEKFVDALTLTFPLAHLSKREASIDLGVKRREVESLLSQYFSTSEAAAATEKCLRAIGVEGKTRISVVELLEFHDEAERLLAGSIGSAAAHKSLSRGTIFTPSEAKELSGVYEEILSNLRISSPDLKRKINYYQKRLRLSEERYYHLVRHSPMLIYILHKGFSLDFINQSCSMILGYTPEEAINTPDWFLDRIHTEDRERIKKLFEAAFESGGLSFSAECRLLHKNGHSVHAIIKSIPSFHWETDFKVERLQGIVIDITDRVLLEKTLTQREMLNVLRTVSSEVAHEIRNPLMSIGGFARRLKKRFPDSSEPEIIMREADRLENLLRRISDYLRPVEIHPEACSINASIAKCLDSLSTEMSSKGVICQRSFDSMLPIIHTDPEILDQIFTNLIRNAVETMGNGETLAIKTFESEQNIHIELRHQIGESKIKQADVLFMPFDESIQNIGLPLCYRLLKYMDGLLSFVQEQDHVVWTVTLPKRN